MVDFSACSLARCGGNRERIQAPEPSLSSELHAAFTQVGFVFLENTGISQEEVRPEDAAKNLPISATKCDFCWG